MANEETKEEEAELDAYMEAAANGEGPSEKERIGFLRIRYEQIKVEYKSLQLQKEEAEALKRQDIVTKINDAFRANYQARKWTVRSLREAGESVSDRFVP